MQLAPASERRFYRIWQARFAILVAGLIVLVASSVLSLKWALEARTEQIEADSQRSQAQLQESLYKHLLSTLPQMPTSLEALRSTVDGIDRLSAGVVDPRMTLQYLSHALDAFPDITLDSIEWQQADWNDETHSTPSSLPASATATVTRQVLSVSASLDVASATDPRAAISRIQAFADTLRQQSNGDVVLVQQPFDTESEQDAQERGAEHRQAPRLPLAAHAARRQTMMRRRANTFTGPALLSLGLLILSAALLWFAHDALRREYAARVSATQEAREAADRYRHTAADESIIRDTIARFHTLRLRGIIGPEQRLDWADRLRSIRDQHHFAQLDFELSPQRIVGPLSTPGDYQLGTSRMQLRAGLLHEGDFFDLMTELRQPGNAIVAPRRCTLTPSAERAAQGINLRAECTLEWLTISATTGAKP